jgi:alkyl hydroperoxide reductase subunit AhpC
VTAYDILNEAANIARVATFIIDGDGVIRYRYVGANKKDRPTAETILSEIRALAASGG